MLCWNPNQQRVQFDSRFYGWDYCPYFSSSAAKRGRGPRAVATPGGRCMEATKCLGNIYLGPARARPGGSTHPPAAQNTWKICWGQTGVKRSMDRKTWQLGAAGHRSGPGPHLPCRRRPQTPAGPAASTPGRAAAAPAGRSSRSRRPPRRPPPPASPLRLGPGRPPPLQPQIPVSAGWGLDFFDLWPQ